MTRGGHQKLRNAVGEHAAPLNAIVEGDASVGIAREKKAGVVGRAVFDPGDSLEVAEHLSPCSAEGFVESLVSMSDVVAFSAAIPFQGGHHHLNEQWPEYWANIFEKKGYVTIDCFRLRLWNERNVHYWYRQNLLLYVKHEALSRYPKLQACKENSWGPLPFVHPALYIPGRAFLSHTWD